MRLKVLNNVGLLGDVETVKELQEVSIRVRFDFRVQGGLRRTFRISLFLTLQICWMSAALWETFSRSLPVRRSSSFWALEASTSTPSCMTTFLTIFSPKKFLLRKSQHWSSSSISIIQFYSLPDLNLPKASLVVLVEVDVDGEMGVDVTHLVLEALGHTDNHVVDDGADSAESGEVLAGTVVHGDGQKIRLGVGERDGDVREVLLEGLDFV